MRICMVAYAHLLHDARIRAYVDTLEQSGSRVDIVALRGHGEPAVEARHSGTTFRIAPKYQGRSPLLYVWSYLQFCLRTALLLTRRSLHERYDAVHIHNMPNALVFTALVPKLCGATIVLDVHDLMPPHYMAKFGATERHIAVRLLKLEQRVASLVASHVLCADHSQREYLIARCCVPEKKVTVVMNLPNERLFGKAPQPRDVGPTFRLVYHGTIAKRLGVDILVRAVARVPSQIPVELWIYGQGDFLDEAIALAHELDVQHKVHFSRSFFAVDMIPTIVSSMDIGVIGNRRDIACEQFMLPVKLLEYVYLGLPVIAPKLPIIRRYFGDDMLKYYEPEDVDGLAACIVDLWNKRSERRRLAQAASAFYVQRNWASQAATYMRILAGSSRMRGLARVSSAQSRR